MIFIYLPPLFPGGGEEQAAAATVFALLCIQLGGGDEAEVGFNMLRPILSNILNDSSASLAARQSVSPLCDNKTSSLWIGFVWWPTGKRNALTTLCKTKNTNA